MDLLGTFKVMEEKSKRFSRRGFLRLTAGGVAGISLAGCGSAAVSPGRGGKHGLSGSDNTIGKGEKAGEQPNIVFILVDDLGWADTGCYGSTYHRTPNIDALAKRGMRFTDAYAACAVCSPTRAAVLTGRYPARIGVTDWIRFLPMHDPRLRGEKAGPYERTKGKDLACPRNPLWMELDELTIAEVLKEHGYATCHIGKWHLGPEKYWPEKQGFDINTGGCDLGQPPSFFDPYYSDMYEGFGHIDNLPPRRAGEYLTDREADEAVNFIKHNRQKPFFLYMAHYAVHKPIEAKKELVEKYKKLPVGVRDNPEYAAMVESVDDAVGRIVEALETSGQIENTLLIFTSDNGGLLPVTSNAPLRKGKGYPYEGGIREPLIISRPGVVKPGTVSSEIVTSVDFFPTILETAGIKPPAGRKIDGLSLVDHLMSGGEKPLDRDAVYWHFPHYRHKDIMPYSIIRSGRWKLIKRYDGRQFELFDLETDLGEKHDLSVDMPEKVAELDKKLNKWLKDVGAKMPKPV